MGKRMYSEYFGIKENAFSITPDPRYLYMSDRHREAFAHLLYGAVESGGFVQLTGEVGTGKTTICRAFLEHLPEKIDVALLLSPPDTPRELLLAIIGELHIPMRTPGAPLKALVDRLNATLLSNHAKGRRTVVIIDEAQNIKPEVIEQVRLLTNLETRTTKLLQVFLIGQPELREQLASVSLRQVAQRITARYHLEPLNLAETEDYIRHRLGVAGCRQGLFNVSAMKRVYQESKGIPRVINILCDRALLGAFACDKAQVDAAMVRYAARQWRGLPQPDKTARRVFLPAAGMTAGALFLAAAVVFAYSSEFHLATVMTPVSAPAVVEPAPVAESPAIEAAQGAVIRADVSPAPVPAAVAVEAPEAAGDAAPAPSAAETDAGGPLRPVQTLDQIMQAQPVGRTSWHKARQILLQQWNIAAPGDADMELCDVAASHGLSCRREVRDMATLHGYNRPAILTLAQADGTFSYGTLIAMDAQWMTLWIGDELFQVASRDLARYWNGEFVLLWAPPLDNIFVIGAGSPEQAVLWLRRALDHADGVISSDRDKTYFDYALQDRVRSFQTRRGLVSDGIAGMQTLTHLLNILGEPRDPVLYAAPPVT